eukprot:TRINITY_DN1517_c0_g1_i5.p1 TRINITY_DN1517_c0_g1~~TRINITY_DN1517_c0_g1_i5.p1  ORF type:complete len:106 (+),score=4.51 TRINITY_DN1517_c0_g1_i5:51-368(+)
MKAGLLAVLLLSAAIVAIPLSLVKDEHDITGPCDPLVPGTFSHIVLSILQLSVNYRICILAACCDSFNAHIKKPLAFLFIMVLYPTSKIMRLFSRSEYFIMIREL